MNAWELPTSLNVSGVVFEIRSDFRAILDILKYFKDPEYNEEEKWLICLDILYVDFDRMPESLYPEAMKQAVAFIDMTDDIPEDNRQKPIVMDWEQDAQFIIPAVNRVIGHEIRLDKYMHWWTFLGAYMEIGDCSYSQIISIRTKQAKGKKLEKWEQEFVKENKALITIKKKLSAEEEEEERRLREKFG